MWAERRSGGESGGFKGQGCDSEAQRDRARIIHSSAFRSLQAKTQVLGIGEHDFYRTRLTHTMEVAQIGSGICESLKEKHDGNEAILTWLPTSSQIEAISLAHDLGHPPFGHGGEVALNHTMCHHGGFEGNGQTLRVVSRLGEYSESHGLDLTRRTLLGLLKYPAVHSRVASYPEAEPGRRFNIEGSRPPKCIHDDEASVLGWILAPLSESDRERFQTVEPREGQHGNTRFKGFDTSIMELGDDIAFGVHDLEDALALGLISPSQWESCVVNRLSGSGPLSLVVDFYRVKLFASAPHERKHAISRMVRSFVESVSVIEEPSFHDPLLRLQAVMAPEAEADLNLLKSFIYREVIRRPEVQAQEFKGQGIVLKLFEVLQGNPDRLLPRAAFELFEAGGNSPRIICDVLASLTDSGATRLYHKFFTPANGSVFDRM